MDKVFVRTAADLEKKYNLSKLAIDAGNIETMNNQIIHLNNQLEDTRKSLIINLGDTLQESVSLWFYEGTPTTENEPYTDWVTPGDHIDDFYYDQLSGYVYKYTANGWERQYDSNLISALALTNTELDVSQDHERKVYLEQPTPPYESGDWWIQEDGTLMICQLGKPSGIYEEDDFIVSTKYTSTIATKQDNTLTLLTGRIISVEEDIDGEEGIRKSVEEIVTWTGEDGSEIKGLKNSVTSIQNTQSQKFSVYDAALENGVAKVVNELVTIDINGINTSRTGETFNTQITNKTFEVRDGTSPLVFVGYKVDEQRTVAQIPELEARQITAGVHRTEIIEEDNELWTADYYVGGES